ncbi:hypothetical protein J2T20_003341 [Paenibacillus wynnii]|nr:hypothetical protein [Paenibacillus wynnii]
MDYVKPSDNTAEGRKETVVFKNAALDKRL